MIFPFINSLILCPGLVNNSFTVNKKPLSIWKILFGTSYMHIQEKKQRKMLNMLETNKKNMIQVIYKTWLDYRYSGDIKKHENSYKSKMLLVYKVWQNWRIHKKTRGITRWLG